MNLIYQTVMRSCYKPGKILPNARWERKKETLVLLYSRVWGGESAYERGGDARRKFWIKPLKETDLGVAQGFFDP